MIELPEAVTIARQIAEVLRGKRIRAAQRGNAPHKLAFYSGPPEYYERILTGQSIGQACADGGLIVVDLVKGNACDHQLVLGGGGERILYHESAETLPKKHQLLLRFDDDSYLTVSVQGWGAVQLFKADESAKRWCGFDKGLMPTDEGFTAAYLDGLIRQLDPEDARSVKYFIISKPGLRGVGNGYLQDILFCARLHPRTRAVDLTVAQRRALHKAVTGTIERAVKDHGRDDEYDLFGRPGRYHRILSAKAVGRPCPNCSTRIVKESFLGGAAYFCLQCQPPPPKPEKGARRVKRAR